MITLKTWSWVVSHQVLACRRAAARRSMAKISSEMPLPMPRWVISSPIHIRQHRAGRQRDHDQQDVLDVELRR